MKMHKYFIILMVIIFSVSAAGMCLATNPSPTKPGITDIDEEIKVGQISEKVSGCKVGKETQDPQPVQLSEKRMLALLMLILPILCIALLTFIIWKSKPAKDSDQNNSDTDMDANGDVMRCRWKDD